jgi:hypothetical protein
MVITGMAKVKMKSDQVPDRPYDFRAAMAYQEPVGRESSKQYGLSGT